MTLTEGRTGAPKTDEWETVIGLEVHAQVMSDAKLFSGAATAFGAEANTQVSLVDAAFPGMLPVINKRCVEQAVRTGLGLNAQINLRSVFDRKNYFYPDLPAGYQISQYKDPIVGEGEVTVDLDNGESRTVRIERLHLEQDAGKSIHDMDPKRTFVDLNRAGVALMEIVSKPDLRSADEAGAYLAKLRSILRYLGTCDGNMEQGSLRADVNVSVRRRVKKGHPDEPLGTRCEIKNLNSIRFIRQAIECEARRQIDILEGGGTIEQETRLFDPARGETRAMRSKEEAHDYRYFPDPDLLPLELDKDWVEKIRASLPELPDAKITRFVDEYGLKRGQALILARDREMADAYEEELFKLLTLRIGEENAYVALFDRRPWHGDHAIQVYRMVDETDISSLAKQSRKFESEVWSCAESIANMIIGDVSGYSSFFEFDVIELVGRADIAGVAYLILSDVISGRIGKEVLKESVLSGDDAAAIVEAKGLKQISDTGAIEAIVDRLIAENPKQVAQAKEQPKVAGWFVGQVMKATRGQANPAVVNEILKKKL